MMIRPLNLTYPRFAKFATAFFALPILGLTAFSAASEHKEFAAAQASPIDSSMVSSGNLGSGTVDVSPADTGALIRDVKAVLTRNYAGVDTVALIGKIQERLQWSEKDDRLIEAEGILHWDRGETHLALPCFRRLGNPSATAMRLMGEGLLLKGERYEAAAWFLKSARAYAPDKPEGVVMYQRYLEIKPGQGKVEMELATHLELQQRYSEALTIYAKHQPEIIADTAAALRIGTMLSGQGRDKDAVALYGQALDAHPANKALWIRQAQTHEILNHKLEAAQAWITVWTVDPLDTNARNRAIAHLEATGPTADTLLKPLVEKALAKDPLSAALNFKLAVINLRANDREAAYLHLDQALKASPRNPTYMSRLPEAIEGDSLIRVHFTYLKSQYEKDGASVRLIQEVARGFSLAGDKVKACRAWSQARTLSAQALDGRRDAFLDLVACMDAASQTAAESVGEKLVAASPDREVLRAMTQVTLHNKSFAKASVYSVKLVNAFPEDATTSLVTAKILLAANDDAGAKDVLTAIVQQVPIPEASFLLGKIHYAAKDCAHAAEQFALAGPAYPEASKLRGECLMQLKDFQGAAAEYESHFARTGDKESLRAQARLDRQLGNALAEKQALETLNAKSWAGEDEKLRLGLLDAAQGDSAKALILFTELLRGKTTLPQDSAWSQAALMLGNRMVQEDKCDKAIKLLTLGLKTAPESVPNRAAVWMQVGDCHIEKSQWKDAYAAYGQGLAADPHSRDLARGQLQAAKKTDDKHELENAYRAIYLLDTADEDANAFLGQACQAAKDYKEAADHFRRLAGLRPNDAKTWESLGNALAMIPDLPAAAVPLQTAIDLGAESDEVYINRARAFRIEGAKDMAASILEFLLTRNPQDYLAVLWSAKFAEEDGEQQIAMELFKKAAKLSPPRTPWPELASQGMLEAKLSDPQ